MVGNVVLWKPARSLLLANYRIIQVLQEAGLPEGVINFVPLCHHDSDVVLGREVKPPRDGSWHRSCPSNTGMRLSDIRIPLAPCFTPAGIDQE
jgi:hypothetical protein